MGQKGRDDDLSVGGKRCVEAAGESDGDLILTGLVEDSPERRKHGDWNQVLRPGSTEASQTGMRSGSANQTRVLETYQRMPTASLPHLRLGSCAQGVQEIWKLMSFSALSQFVLSCEQAEHLSRRSVSKEKGILLMFSNEKKEGI